MNKKEILLVLTVVVFIIAGAISWQLYGNRNQNIPDTQKNIQAEITASTKTPEPNDFTASFEIYTQATKRIFTAAMYHNQSPNVFIQNPDPSIIYVKKAGITWTDFFETLPFTLTKECLVTGTGQTFCNTKAQKLRFFLNNSESPNVLDLKIQPGDALRIIYGD